MTDITTSEHLGTEIHPKEVPNAIASLFHMVAEHRPAPSATTTSPPLHNDSSNPSSSWMAHWNKISYITILTLCQIICGEILRRHRQHHQENIVLEALMGITLANSETSSHDIFQHRQRYVLGVFQRPLTLILLQKYRDTNGSRIVMQIGGVYTTFCQKEGILLQKYRDRNGRCIAILFRSIRGQGSILLS